MDSIIIKNLLVGDHHFVNNLPIIIKRLYYINSFNNYNEFKNYYLDIDINTLPKGGSYANINFDEIYIILDGIIILEIIDTFNNKIIKTLKKNDTYHINKMNWVEYKILSDKTIILVLVNETLENSNIITDFNKYLSNNI